jgi:hypothetical protein
MPKRAATILQQFCAEVALKRKTTRQTDGDWR